ncbi:MAG: PAS domain-containing protein [Deltaproteobacteria bacterium]|nr:PAS domain-containing protein [Deltaproteobacteria bacterium]
MPRSNAAAKRPPCEFDLNENLWVEMIRSMEGLYADLATAQTEMERRAEQLQASHNFVEGVIRNMVNALVVVDPEGHVTLANESCRRLLGLSEAEIVGRPLESFFAPECVSAVHPGSVLWRKLLSGGAVRDVETQLTGANGLSVPVSLNASLLGAAGGEIEGVVLVATDLRETKRLLENARREATELERAYRELKSLQARLIQSEKMSSLGRMAASVAHEINNPLGGILVYSHLLLEEAPDDSPGAGMLRKIVRETTRCKEIVRGLLGFARQQQGEHHALDLVQVVAATVDGLGVQPLFRGIERRVELPCYALPVEGEEGPLQQALTNILVNAAEALAGKGRIDVRAWKDVEAGTAVVSVADDGPGIPPEGVDQIFEPFFTTKEIGHGTGLGLAVTYGIVRQHAGSIEVRSRPGEGATFTLSLPLRRAERSGR